MNTLLFSWPWARDVSLDCSMFWIIMTDATHCSISISYSTRDRLRFYICHTLSTHWSHRALTRTRRYCSLVSLPIADRTLRLPIDRSTSTKSCQVSAAKWMCVFVTMLACVEPAFRNDVFVEIYTSICYSSAEAVNKHTRCLSVENSPLPATHSNVNCKLQIHEHRFSFSFISHAFVVSQLSVYRIQTHTN